MVNTISGFGTRGRTVAQWIENRDAGGGTTHHVYGTLGLRDVGAALRARESVKFSYWLNR
jgi:hypothetical protein